MSSDPHPHSDHAHSELALCARDLGKRYTIQHKAARHSTLAESLLHTLRHPLRRNSLESFWALRNISFDIYTGDIVGIIGRNGAGKSTLLKILSQITEPSTGAMDIYGQVGSLLEVGTGFHPELTGRENIYLNGAILGMRRRDIQRQFDAIVDFAGVEKFLDTPVKRFSSGMYIRLAFAVAAHLNPDILVIDEVLSVGDADFQKKCLGKMREVSSTQGRTVLFVSHNLAAVRQLCTRAIYLQSGKMIAQGPTDQVLDRYAASRQQSQAPRTANEHGLTFMDLALLDAQTLRRTEHPLFARDYLLRTHIHVSKPLTLAAINLRLYDETGTKITTIGSIEEGLPPTTLQGDIHLECHFPALGLYPGRYLFSLEVSRPNDPATYLQIDDALAFEVQPAILNDSMWSYSKSHGLSRLATNLTLLPKGSTIPTPESSGPQQACA